MDFTFSGVGEDWMLGKFPVLKQTWRLRQA